MDILKGQDYLLMLNHLPIGYAILKTQHNSKGIANDYLLSYANNHFLDIVGGTLEDKKNHSISSIFSNELTPWHEMLKGLNTQAIEITFNSYYAEKSKYYEVKAFKMEDGLIGCFVTDLSKNMTYEEHLKERNEEIQAQNEEYRALNEELSESYEKAQESNTMLTQKEKELKDSNQMLQLVLDHIPARVFWKDRQSDYLGCNKNFAVDAGKAKAEDIIGKTDIDFFKKEIGELYRRDDQIVMTSDVAKLNYEEPQATEGEELRYLRTNKIPLHDEFNKVIGVLGTYEEITELKKVQDELIKAKEKAEESDRLKSAFLANMSHEIRTPMNGIVGFVQLLNHGELSETDREKYLEIINDSSMQLLRIVNDIIDISKIESGLVIINKKETNLVSLIKDCVLFHEKSLQTKSIKIEFHNKLNSNAFIIFTDETKIRQVFDNLISNAIKFTEQGKITVKAVHSKNELHFSIIDTGIGIPTEYLDSIFDRFRQAEEHLERNYGGTGLGLTICKKYIEVMGGKIWVESKSGQGSCFNFTLPY